MSAAWAIGALLCGIWLIFARRYLLRRGAGLVWVGGVGVIATVLANHGLWAGAARGYAGDTYWTLGLTGRIGVAAISVIGIGGLFAAIGRTLHWPVWQRLGAFGPVTNAGLGVLLFACLFAVAPQAFYTLYGFLVPTLPAQIVVRSPFDTARLRDIAQLDAGGSLAAHLAGLTLLAIPAFVGLAHRRGPLSFAAVWLWLVATALI